MGVCGAGRAVSVGEVDAALRGVGDWMVARRGVAIAVGFCESAIAVGVAALGAALGAVGVDALAISATRVGLAIVVRRAAACAPPHLAVVAVAATTRASPATTVAAVRRQRVVGGTIFVATHEIDPALCGCGAGA